MCPICGCGIDAERGSVHAENDRVAVRNRAHFDVHGVLAINLNSSPGAGKTTLLEATIVALGDRYRIALIDGNPDTDRATSPTRVHDVAAVQITTGTGCHLDAHLVHRAVYDLPLAEVDLLFIENAGNSACPGGFDLGQHHNVTLLSVTEASGDPAGFPPTFGASDLVILSKIDLLEGTQDFDPAPAAAALRELGRKAPIIQTAARRALSLAPWLEWVEKQLCLKRANQQLRAPMLGGAAWG